MTMAKCAFPAGLLVASAYAKRSIYFAYAMNAPWDFVSNPVAIDIIP